MGKVKSFFSSISNFLNPRLVIKKDSQYMSFTGRKNLSSNNYGKWIIIDNLNKIKKYTELLKPFVENKTIAGFKYTHKERVDTFPEYKPTLMVYCDIKDREKLKSLLESLGLKLERFIEQHETIESWGPGGYLIQESSRQMIVHFLNKMISDLKYKRDVYPDWINFLNFFQINTDLPKEIRNRANMLIEEISKLFRSKTNEKEINNLLIKRLVDLNKIFNIKYTKKKS